MILGRACVREGGGKCGEKNIIYDSRIPRNEISSILKYLKFLPQNVLRWAKMVEIRKFVLNNVNCFVKYSLLVNSCLSVITVSNTSD